MAPSAHRKYKKFDQILKEKIKVEVKQLSEFPYRYEELKGALKCIRSSHFKHSEKQYRIAYRILEETTENEVVLEKTRESFYQTLRRIIK